MVTASGVVGGTLNDLDVGNARGYLFGEFHVLSHGDNLLVRGDGRDKRSVIGRHFVKLLTPVRARVGESEQHKRLLFPFCGKAE